MDLLRSLKFGLNSDQSNPEQDLGTISVRQEGLIDAFPGPAFLVDKDLQVLQHNKKAEPVLRAFSEGQEEALVNGICNAIQNQTPAHEVLSFGVGDGVQVVDLTLLPLTDRDDVLLVTGKNVTLQRNLVNALVTSRQLFKDLVTCTAEFVWETDQGGHFKYVSPRGAIGFTAAELDGRIARRFIMAPEIVIAEGSDSEKIEERVNPFESQVPLEDQIVWLQNKSAGMACMKISSIPIYDEDGSWTGCRGAGHDITEEVSQRAHLDRLAAHEEMLSEIIDAIRHEIDPKKLFEIAARGACDALNSTRIWLGRENMNAEMATAFMLGVDESTENTILDWFKAQEATAPDGYELAELETEECRVFMSPIFSGNRVGGGIALVRRIEATELEDSERRLLRLISEHLGVALIQINAREKLEKLSRTDELTGLLNRRAFKEDVIKRLEHSKRVQSSSALFYIDLDNFKPVNDSYGHEKGDDVLRGVSSVLQHNTRIEDMVARLGGDEFAMWLEDIPEDKAIAKAGDMQERCRVLSEELEILDPKLSLSIGIAMVSGDPDETIQGLLAAADTAMYEVKERGKGAYAIAQKKAWKPRDKEC